ncbi:hypothetical protein FJR48_09480 [Sulfurimonas lithotrophica]|uniref:Uncharacterized protein n=1 Tax=Sulfurimonas lithotrophica TaxID=2590022 RepID=A0A5P8P2N6_9BACT|nr:hypothetical protein [Sulfurimonas lithotrophica]QFR49944.1 hypothetical protein FJR48_09480 [Sulfurimonas lithotrophica]
MKNSKLLKIFLLAVMLLVSPLSSNEGEKLSCDAAYDICTEKCDNAENPSEACFSKCDETYDKCLVAEQGTKEEGEK